MARISGVDLPKNKRIEISLMYLFGVGRYSSNKILKVAGVDPGKRTKDLTDEEVSKVTQALQGSGYRVEGELRHEISANIRRLMEIGAWRGMRHKKGLPVRGQRTRTNSRTRKGPRKGGLVLTKKKEGPKPAIKPKA